MVVDFERVNRSIKKDNLDIKLMRIVYEGLAKFEADEVLRCQGGGRIGEGRVLSYYPKDTEPLYKEKAKEVLYFGGRVNKNGT
jgi:hypothetical protein